jgi:hypothetical protein
VNPPAPAPPEVVAPVALPVAPSSVDVELVTGPPASALRLSRRDFVVFGIGAGAGALATFVGLVIALSRKKE